MRVLITGGTGFLGQYVARELLAAGDEPVLAGRALERIDPALAARAALRLLDLRDHDAVTAACAGVDAVVHAGELSAPWGPTLAIRATNIGGTASVIAGCRRHGVRRLLYVSSPSVVFDGRNFARATEAAAYPRRFVCAYALTKKVGEDLIREAAADLDTVIMRPTALFGPGDRTLLPRLLDAARRRQLPVIGDGRNWVDLTYVENAAQAIALALRCSRAVGRTYTITNDEPTLIWDVIRRILRALDLPPPGPRLPLAVALLLARIEEAAAARARRQPTLTRYTVLVLSRTQTYDITAARRDLGYRPRVPLEEGIARTVADLQARQ
jgi:nucleoside-diphosphate-sugar epimerase